MKWTVEAKNQARILPSFARHRFRRKLEEEARKQGWEIIGLEEIRRLIKDEEIQSLIELDKKINDLDYSQNVEFNICGGIRGCRFSQADDLALVELLKNSVDRSGILKLIEENRQAGRPGGKRIKLGLASCPNSCSQAQIQDLAILVTSRPRIDFSSCISCGRCQKACPLDIIDLEKEEFLREECIGCNACLRACPTDAIIQGGLTYKILIGGRLGRLPSLAKLHKEVDNLQDLEEEVEIVLDQLKSCIEQGLSWSHYLD